MPPAIPSWKQVLRFLFASTLILQTAIVLACVALEYANREAGWMRYRVPQFLFWVYVWVGIGAPVTALVTLLILWVKKDVLWNKASDADAGKLSQLVVLCVVNVCSVVAWFVLGGLVFFGAGGNR